MQHRQLVAIMFTDVVSYSALTQRSEVLAMELLELHRQVLRSAITGFDGKEIKTIGDGFLIEFSSDLQAVQAAVAIQEGMSQYNLDAGPERQIQIRIGVHIGDVIHKEGDVYGDGVNIASRIEKLAPAGGIAITGAVYSGVQNKLDTEFYPLGEQFLKNIDYPVAIYVDRAPVGPAYARLTQSMVGVVIAAVLLTMSLFFGFKYWVGDRQSGETVSVTRSTHGLEGDQHHSTASAGKGSIAVLPFVNMSEDPDNEYFSDGLSEEILNLLTKVPELKVIGRTSSFAFKGKNEDLRVIGQKLGVKTVLEGSVRKSGDRVRITAQLIDVSDGTNIWSETYERTMTEIFAVQDNVAASIIDALQVHVKAKPSRGQPTESPKAYTLFLRARTLMNAHKASEASKLLQQVTSIDPDFAEAYEMLAFSYWSQGGGALSVDESLALMGQSSSKALDIDSDLAFAQAIYHLSTGGSQYRLKAIKELERAVREHPGNPWSLRMLIYELQFAGYQRESLRYAQQYMIHDPLSPMANYCLGEALYSTGRAAEATAPLTYALDLGETFAQEYFPAMQLVEGNEALFISRREADLVRLGIDATSWVRDLVSRTKEKGSGQAYLDSGSEEILSSLTGESRVFWAASFETWYLYLGFLDRYYEIIFAAGPNDKVTTNADVLVWVGTVFRTTGFTSHPRYVEIAGMLGLFDIWEQRGPPDFCEKETGEWVCR